MAARRREERQDDAPEVGLVADPDGDEEEGVPEGFSVAGDEDGDEDGDEELAEDDELEDDELEDDEGLDDDDLADVDAVLAGAVAVPVPAAVAEDDAASAVLPADEDDEDTVEGIRDDIEFVCVRCRLVKRTSQLAKGARKKEPFCRSCA